MAMQVSMGVGSIILSISAGWLLIARSYLSGRSSFSPMATSEVLKKKEKVYVWLPWDYDYAKHILSWVLSNFPNNETQIVATFIISTNYPDDKLNRWRKICNKTLDKHLAQCAIHEFKAEKLIREMGGSLVKGILELIDLREIKNLVMDVSPTSELVRLKANPSCMIWFIQNGNLLYYRYPKLDLTEAPSGELLRRKRLHQKEIEEIQKRENDKNDLLKRENEQLKLENQLLQNQLKELSSDGSSTFNEEHVPSHFICPITQDIMKNPCTAADGFTYEAEAIKKWLNRGHDKSPMTNLVLPHYHLIQNHVLRSAIQEWLDQHPCLERNSLIFHVDTGRQERLTEKAQVEDFVRV